MYVSCTLYPTYLCHHSVTAVLSLSSSTSCIRFFLFLLFVFLSLFRHNGKTTILNVIICCCCRRRRRWKREQRRRRQRQLVWWYTTIVPSDSSFVNCIPNCSFLRKCFKCCFFVNFFPNSELLINRPCIAADSLARLLLFVWSAFVVGRGSTVQLLVQSGPYLLLPLAMFQLGQFASSVLIRRLGRLDSFRTAFLLRWRYDKRLPSSVPLANCARNSGDRSDGMFSAASGISSAHVQTTKCERM